MTLEEQLIQDEGLRLTVYFDTVGVPTIGVGRNLKVGITRDEAVYLLRNDIARVQRELAQALPWYLHTLSQGRRGVLDNMAFNLGTEGLLKFTNTLGAIKAGNYTKAASLMLDSKWAGQVKGRAQRLATQMRDDTQGA